MRFELYSEKSERECMKALSERLSQKSSRSRLNIWIDQKGAFSMTHSTTVLRYFTRTTRLNGRLGKEGGQVVVRGSVSDGADPRSRLIIYTILVILGVGIILFTRSFIPGALLFLMPLVLHIPLQGDYENSRALMSEVQRTLKARATPPAARKPPARAGAKDAKTGAARKPPEGISIRSSRR